MPNGNISPACGFSQDSSASEDDGGKHNNWWRIYVDTDENARWGNDRGPGAGYAIRPRCRPGAEAYAGESPEWSGDLREALRTDAEATPRHRVEPAAHG